MTGLSTMCSEAVVEGVDAHAMLSVGVLRKDKQGDGCNVGS
jgi:hypothetical protein